MIVAAVTRTVPALRVAALASIAALLLCLAAAGPARAIPYRGAQTHPFWDGSSASDADRELAVLRASGANAVRVDIGWSNLEPDHRGAFDGTYVARVDTFMRDAAARGIRVIATLMTTPCWASSAPPSLAQGCTGSWWDRGVPSYPPRDPQDLARAAAWVARRWAPSLAALEIWNEPNQSTFLVSSDPAADYARMLDAAYAAVKAAAPSIPVLAGALSEPDTSFLQRLYADGIHGHFDGISIHPYNGASDPSEPDALDPASTFLTGVPRVHALMAANGDAVAGLWLTELGYTSCTDGDALCVSEQQQQRYVRDQLELAGRWPYVRAAIVYDLRDDAEAPDPVDSFGLLHVDFRPKPAFQGFRDALLAQAPFGAEIGPASFSSSEDLSTRIATLLTR